MDDFDLTIASELRRKTFEELSRIWERYLSGKSTLAQTQASILTIWNITSGLVHDDDYTELMAALGGEIEARMRARAALKPAEFMLFRSDAESLLVTRTPDSDTAGTFTILKVVEVDFTEKTVAGAEVDNTRTKLINLFTGRGMRLVSYC